MSWVVLLGLVAGCAIRTSSGSICGSGPVTITSYSLLTKPRWSVVCPDGRAMRFESNSEVEELKALMEQHNKKQVGD